MNRCYAPTPFSSLSSLDSWISIGFCVVALGLVATLVLFQKMPFCSLSNISLAYYSMSFAHLIATLIFFVNLFHSSHLDDDGDTKGEIVFNRVML
jgi:hypothetical protein